jgi:hypothetical protein
MSDDPNEAYDVVPIEPGPLCVPKTLSELMT